MHMEEMKSLRADTLWLKSNCFFSFAIAVNVLSYPFFPMILASFSFASACGMCMKWLRMIWVRGLQLRPVLQSSLVLCEQNGCVSTSHPTPAPPTYFCLLFYIYMASCSGGASCLPTCMWEFHCKRSWILIHVCIHIHIYMHIYIYIYVCMYIYIYVYMYIYTYVYIYIYVYIYTYVYIYISVIHVVYHLHHWYKSYTTCTVIQVIHHIYHLHHLIRGIDEMFDVSRLLTYRDLWRISGHTRDTPVIRLSSSTWSFSWWNAGKGKRTGPDTCTRARRGTEMGVKWMAGT